MSEARFELGADTLWLALTVVLCLVHGPVTAQTAPGSGLERRTGPGGERLEMPDFYAPEAPGFVLPGLPDPKQSSRAPVDQTTIFIRDIVITGNTVLDDELTALIADRKGREFTTEEILILRDQITGQYVDAGYITSGAQIPIVDGDVLIFSVAEGTLTYDDLRVSDIQHLRPNYVRRRLDLDNAGPFNFNDLRDNFELLVADPNIDKIDGRLIPGNEPGSAVLELDVDEVDRFLIGAEIANDRALSVGGEHYSIEGLARNIIGLGEVFTAEIGTSKGLIDGTATFSMPLSANDLSLNLFFEGSDAEVVEEPLNELDILSESYAYGGGLTFPVFRSLRQTFGISGSISHRHTETSLLGIPFSFSPGAVNGKTRITVGRLGQDWVLRSPSRVIAARSTFSVGLTANDTPFRNDLTPPEHFLTWLGQIQFAQRMTGSGQQLLARIDAQISKNSLFATEKFPIGGIDSVRGYRQNEILSDSGVVVSAEYQIPVFDIPFFFGEARTGSRNLSVAAFAEGGYAWNVEGPNPEVNKVGSVGAGVIWTPTDRVEARLFWGHQLNEIERSSRNDIQDHGIHFRLISRLY